jgi:lipopolysaccharide export system ATP-binding protein
MLEPTRLDPEDRPERGGDPLPAEPPAPAGSPEDRRLAGDPVLPDGTEAHPSGSLRDSEGAASPLGQPDGSALATHPPTTGSEPATRAPAAPDAPRQEEDRIDVPVGPELPPLEPDPSDRSREGHEALASPVGPGSVTEDGDEAGSGPQAVQETGSVPGGSASSIDFGTRLGDGLEADAATEAAADAPPASATVPGVPLSTHLPGAPAIPRVRGSTLEAKGLVKTYRKRRVVNNVDLHVSQGEIVGLLGPNGAGKTTTFYMMVGLIAPDAGRVLLDRDDITRTPMYRRARRGVGYLSQEPSVFRKLTVEDNVLAVLQMLGIPRREQRVRLEELLDELGIKHLRDSKGYALSGGERRRLEITRALVGRPKFMLLDEPFAGVDPIAVHDIQQIVADLRRRNIGVLISDHNVEQTLDIVDRAYIMYDGRVRISGTVSELVWNDEVAEIYLGPTLTARMRQRYTYPAQD